MSTAGWVLGTEPRPSAREYQALLMCWPTLLALIYLINLYLFVCVSMFARYVGVFKGRKRTLEPTDPQVQVAVSCLIWVLGTEQGLLEGQQMLLTTQPLGCFFVFCF